MIKQKDGFLLLEEIILFLLFVPRFRLIVLEIVGFVLENAPFVLDKRGALRYTNIALDKEEAYEIFN